MSWIAIDLDSSWQDLAIAQQIAVAYNKRAASCPTGVSAAQSIETRLSVSSIDQAVTVLDFIYQIQTGIQEMAIYFADNTTSLSGQSSVPANFSLAADFMTFAGLTESGYWRRIAEGGTQPETWTDYDDEGWSYGKITSKDLAGPWLWQDIQTALTAMTRRVLPADVLPSNAYFDEATAESNTWVANDPFPVPSGNADMGAIDYDDKPLADLSVTKQGGTRYARTQCRTSVRLYVANFYGSYSQFSSYKLVFIPTGTSTFSGVTGWPQNTLDLTRNITCTLNTAGILSAYAWASRYATPSWSSIAAELPDNEVDQTSPYEETYRFMAIKAPPYSSAPPVIVLDYAFSPA